MQPRLIASKRELDISGISLMEGYIDSERVDSGHGMVGRSGERNSKEN